MTEKWRIPSLAELSTLMSYSEDKQQVLPKYANSEYWSKNAASPSTFFIAIFQEKKAVIRTSHFIGRQTDLILVRRRGNSILQWSKIYFRLTYYEAVEKCSEINIHNLNISVEYHSKPVGVKIDPESGNVKFNSNPVKEDL